MKFAAAFTILILIFSSCDDADVTPKSNHLEPLVGIWYSDRSNKAVEIHEDNTFNFLRGNYATGKLEKNFDDTHQITFLEDSFQVKFSCDLVIENPLMGSVDPIPRHGSYQLLEDKLLLDLQLFPPGDTLRRVHADERVVSRANSNYGCRLNGYIADEYIDGTFRRSNYYKSWRVDFDATSVFLYLNLYIPQEIPGSVCLDQNRSSSIGSVRIAIEDFHGVGAYDLNDDTVFEYLIGGDIISGIWARHGSLEVTHYDEKERRIQGKFSFAGSGNGYLGREQLSVENGWFDIYW